MLILFSNSNTVYSGKTFVIYAQSQKIEKLNNVKLFGYKKTKRPEPDSKSQPRSSMFEGDNFSINNYMIQELYIWIIDISNINHVSCGTCCMLYVLHASCKQERKWSVNTISIQLKCKICALVWGRNMEKKKAMLSKIQRFINYCLRTITNIQWFDKVRNEDLWQRANQDPINKQIKKRKQAWIWPHTEETAKQHHQTGPQMEPTKQNKQRTTQKHLAQRHRVRIERAGTQLELGRKTSA